MNIAWLSVTGVGDNYQLYYQTKARRFFPKQSFATEQEAIDWGVAYAAEHGNIGIINVKTRTKSYQIGATKQNDNQHQRQDETIPVNPDPQDTGPPKQPDIETENTSPEHVKITFGKYDKDTNKVVVDMNNLNATEIRVWRNTPGAVKTKKLGELEEYTIAYKVPEDGLIFRYENEDGPILAEYSPTN